ncbi:MAG: cbb3-type cytochrome c oxidase subunit I, partial [Gammaproteobacteria bacterium]|nr:cbb3-type cytochrome c oxidase subunit I [Gammaproteobacteria bacterium]
MPDPAKKLSVEIYSDRVVTTLVMFSVIWAVIGMLAGVYVAAEMVWPALNFDQSWLSFGRLRTFHTNVVIFGFGVSALMGTAYYSVQRTSHVRLYASNLAWFTCWAWQIAILAGGISLLMGLTTS